LNPLSSDLDHVLARTHGLWEELRGQRLFLTGGTGFFGLWLLETFAWANERLGLNASTHVLTRDPDAFRAKAGPLAALPAIRLHRGDVRSFELPPGPFSHVIHAATEANAHVIAENPLQVFDVNLAGTRRVLEFARQRQVRRFLFTSSGAIYGRQPADLALMPETFLGGPDPTEVVSTYGASGEAKRAAETLCGLYLRQYGLETVIARCFTFVGPHLPLEGKFAVGNFMRDGLEGRPIRVNGDGTPSRSYLYAADLAIWLWTLLFKGQPGQAYNVGSEAAISIADLARLIGRSAPRPVPVQVAREPLPGQAPERYVPSTHKARATFGLLETIPLAEAIQRTFSWHQQFNKG
jgi:nucleoside-diphosphate-sugar epimerase